MTIPNVEHSWFLIYHPKGVGVTYANVYMLDSSVPKNDYIEGMLDEYRYAIVGSLSTNYS